MSIERKDYEITAIIPNLTEEDYKRLCGQLGKWYRLGPQMFSRDGDKFVFDATHAGRDNAPILAARVEALFLGFLLGKAR